MQTKTYLLIFMIFCAQQALASTLPLSTYCDTIFTTEGKMYLAQIIEQDSVKVEYYLCDSDNPNSFKLNNTAVTRIGYTAESKRKKDKSAFRNDPVGRLAYPAIVLVLVGLGCVGLMGAYGIILGIPLLVWGTIRAEKALRRLRRNPDQPFARKSRKLARLAILLSQSAMIVGMSLYVLVNWFLG